MAAAVLTLLRATKNSLTYSVTGATTETIALDGTHASIATTLPAGPLKDLLTTGRADAAAHIAALIGDATAPTAQCSLRISVDDEQGYLEALVGILGGAGTVFKLDLTGYELVGAGGFRSILKLEYRHSVGR